MMIKQRAIMTMLAVAAGITGSIAVAAPAQAQPCVNPGDFRFGACTRSDIEITVTGIPNQPFVPSPIPSITQPVGPSSPVSGTNVPVVTYPMQPEQRIRLAPYGENLPQYEQDVSLRLENGRVVEIEADDTWTNPKPSIQPDGSGSFEATSEKGVTLTIEWTASASRPGPDNTIVTDYVFRSNVNIAPELENTR